MSRGASAVEWKGALRAGDEVACGWVSLLFI